MYYKENYFILTGGPGSGKTTLINKLQEMGYAIVPEVGREIIKEQIATGGDALPWKDTTKYAQQMLQHAVSDFLKHTSDDGLYLFDRGIGDSLGYASLIELCKQTDFNTAVKRYRYNEVVFICPPWEEIYQTDNERLQDYELAVRTYHAIEKVYLAHGYKLIEVPKTHVNLRAQFIIEHLKLHKTHY